MAGGFMDVINNVGKFGQYLKEQMGMPAPPTVRDHDEDDPDKPRAMLHGSQQYRDQVDELGHYNPNAPKGR